MLRSRALISCLLFGSRPGSSITWMMSQARFQYYDGAACAHAGARDVRARGDSISIGDSITVGYGTAIGGTEGFLDPSETA
jgi:hypothetical protein